MTDGALLFKEFLPRMTGHTCVCGWHTSTMEMFHRHFVLPRSLGTVKCDSFRRTRRFWNCESWKTWITSIRMLEAWQGIEKSLNQFAIRDNLYMKMIEAMRFPVSNEFPVTLFVYTPSSSLSSYQLGWGITWYMIRYHLITCTYIEVILCELFCEHLSSNFQYACHPSASIVIVFT